MQAKEICVFSRMKDSIFAARQLVVLGGATWSLLSGSLTMETFAQDELSAGDAIIEKDASELLNTFRSLLSERARLDDPEALEIQDRARKNGGRFGLSHQALKELVEKWSVEDPPSKVTADFEMLLYQKVKEGEPEAVRIYQQAVKSGGQLQLTYPRMKELVAKWKGKKVKTEDLTLKFDPEFSIGKNKALSYTTKNNGELMLAKATINGIQETFIIDTGCSHSVISRELAAKLQIEDQIRKVNTTGNISGKKQQLARIDSLQISDALFANFDAFILPLAHFTGIMGQKISGFIGSNLLSVRPYTIRLKDQTIVFGKRVKQASAIEAPMIVISGRPGFEMTVNAREKLKFIIDSGATESIIPASSYEGKLIKKRGPVEVDINRNRGSQMRSYAQPEIMMIGDSKLKCIPLKLSETQKVGLLGTDFLKYYDVFIDHQSRKLYFTLVGDEQPAR